MQDKEYWHAVTRRDHTYDGHFVFAVRSTGIYCRPSCPSRRPRQEQVAYFYSAAEAEAAGFRSCKRCRPDQAAREEPNLETVQRICRYLEQPHDHLPTLDELASQFALSPYYLQRTFKRLVGVSPRQYAAARRLERFKSELKDGRPVTAALYEAGYQSVSSAYGPANEQMGMTPALYRQGARAVKIGYAVAPSPLGLLLVAATDKGVCAIKFGDDMGALESALRREFPAAVVERDETALSASVNALQRHLQGAQPHLDLPLDVRATAFQQRVWAALRAIPYGATRSYRDIAQAIGEPKAARAVAQACAANPVPLVVPCHRVVRENGHLGGYRWGEKRKEKLLQQEASAVVANR
jgi:AraC family transcriptional regulator of adaptative response/methylated-DNA-[protein]-cysteine methyltransferase